MKGRGCVIAGSIGFYFLCCFAMTTNLPMMALQLLYPRGYLPLISAIDSKNPRSVAAVLASGVNPNNYPGDEGPPLSEAVSVGNIDTVKVLLNYGANPNISGPFDDSPLICATEKSGRIDIMKLLFERGAKVNDRKNGSSALSIACLNGKPVVVEFLLDHGANPNSTVDEEKPESLIHAMVSRHKWPDIIQMLRKYGAKE